jgi:predicted nucleic acid-binding protein
VSDGLLDTSVFVAQESGRPVNLELVPDSTYVSVITFAELHAGVLAAPDVDTRSRRMATVEFAGSIQMLPIDEQAARHWARLRIRLRDANRSIKVNDLWIASAALANDLPIVTQDGDFDVLDELSLASVIRV